MEELNSKMGLSIEDINIGKAQKFKIFKDAREFSKIAQAMQKFEQNPIPRKDNTGYSIMFQPIINHSASLMMFMAKIISDDEYQDKMATAFRIRESGMELDRAINAYFDAIESKPRLVRYRAFILEKLEDIRYDFLDLIETFDKENFTPDPWGVWNPPGIDSLDFYK